MKKLLLGLVLLLALLAAMLALPPVRAMLVAATLPDYPDWPEPTAALSAADRGTIYFASRSPYDLEVILGDLSLARPTTGIGTLSFPDGASPEDPVPAMVIVHGSGGIAPGREDGYADLFNRNGIAAFVIDYYAPRGFSRDDNYLVRTSAVTEFDLIADAYAALALLGTSPLIDAGRIGIIGFSYGGMAARLSMDARIHAALAPDSPPFSLHIDNYGPCFQDLQSREVTGGPLLTLRGSEDASNDLAACAEREYALRELGVDVTSEVYGGVGHAWENSEPRFFAEDAPYLAGCELVYDAQGKPLLNGEPLHTYAADATHATKMAARFSSAGRFRDCVGYGYYVGRDEEARQRGYSAILDFLSAHWGTP